MTRIDKVIGILCEEGRTEASIRSCLMALCCPQDMKEKKCPANHYWGGSDCTRCWEAVKNEKA